jgi:hypothetical protein
MTISTEQFLTVNTGTVANDGTGDDLRSAFIKVNENFIAITDVGFDAGNIDVSGSIQIAGNLSIDNDYVPTANTDPGQTGQIVWDTDHIYICVATNSWKRANLAAW